MTPGIFELYYSKAGKKKLPNKGKNKEEDKDKSKEDKEKDKKEEKETENMKAKQMKREGNCKLYIDPHQWDVTIWTMREHTAPPPPKPKPAPPPPTYNQHPPGYYYGGSYGATHPYQHYHSYPPQHPQHPSHPPPPPVRKPPPPAKPNPPPPTNQSQPTDPNAVQSKPAPDPVIHMLAERANTNFKLRDIMKIVARGDATKEQLEYFQSHINELTERLEAQKKAQQAQRPPAPRPAPPPVQASPAPPPQPVQARPPTQTSQTPLPTHASTAPPPTQASQAPPSTHAPQASTPVPPPAAPSAHPASAPAANGAPHSLPPPSPATPTPSKMPQQPPMTYYTPPPQPGPYGHYAPPPPPPPQPAQPPPPPQPPQPTYRALCIDFNTNGDRLLFPRETILEALPGNQVLASFLKVQKVDHLTLAQLPKTQTYYKILKEYYQPITVRFRADNASVLQCLFRWVKPQEEVRKHMEEIMDRAEPAEDVELAARLPREGVVQEGTSMVLQADEKIAEARGKGKEKEAVKESVERVGTPVGERDKKRKRVR
ncbi:hypothetical protein MPH_05784 [Macrophomina phaseolina MS6]|uniref:Uncharacterized protein n=1 Tax=Macrophomina phaseolina (strain MS6) TaxID=1126212 RepID=K2S377_MACPH|nr:hypothetical protein MPH_05784 [Macrophomina phaseolina MS6]